MSKEMNDEVTRQVDAMNISPSDGLGPSNQGLGQNQNQNLNQHQQQHQNQHHSSHSSHAHGQSSQAGHSTSHGQMSSGSRDQRHRSSASTSRSRPKPTPERKELYIPEGFYHINLNNTDFIIPERYQNLHQIGVGAYGSVCSADDADTGYKVAVKKLARPFQSLIHAKRAFRELRLLKHMYHENVIFLLDCFTPDESVETFESLYLVTHLMGADLHNIIRVQKLTDDHIQFIIYQILRALKYIHSAGIIHRDLKLANIAVNEDVELRILDFGLARMHSEEMTGYVATRWYRAPEIMLNWMRYDVTVDMWSVGCILGELMLGKPLFPGKDYMLQLKLIMNLCGKPSKEYMDRLDSDHAKSFIDQLPETPRCDFKTVFQDANPLALDLIDRLLVLDPKERPTAVECLRHPYLETYHDSDDEPECPEFYDESVEKEEKDINGWKLETWKEYYNFVPPESDYSDSDDDYDTSDENEEDYGDYNTEEEA